MSSSEWERGYAAGWKAAHGEKGYSMQLERSIDPANIKTPIKRKRKVSAYSKRYGAAYKRLKAKHPRMSFGALSKKAHKEARRK